MSDSARIPKTRYVLRSSRHCPPQSRPQTMSCTQSGSHPEPSVASPPHLPSPAKSLSHLLSFYDLNSDSDSDIDFDTFIQRSGASKPQSKSIQRPVAQKTPQPQPISLGRRIPPTQVTKEKIRKPPSKNMSDDGMSNFDLPQPTDSEWDSELDQPMSYTRKGILAGGPSCMRGSKEAMPSRVLGSKEVLAKKRSKVSQETLLKPMAERQEVGQPAAPPPKQSPNEDPARRVGLRPVSVAQPRQSTNEELYDPFGRSGRGPVGWLDQGEDVDEGTDDDDDEDDDEDEDEDLLSDVAQSDPLIERHLRANTKLSRSTPQYPGQQPQPHTYRPAEPQNRSPGIQGLTAPQTQSLVTDMTDANDCFPAVSGVGSEVEFSEQDLKILQHTRGLHGVTPAVVEKCYNDLLTRAKARKHPEKLCELLPNPHIDQPAGEGQSKQGSLAKSALDNTDFGATGIREEWEARERESRQGTRQAHVLYLPQPATINAEFIDQGQRGGKKRRATQRGVQAAMRSYQLPIAESPTFGGEEVHIPYASTLSPSPSTQGGCVKAESAEAQRVQAANSLPPLKRKGRPARPRPEAKIDPGTGGPVVPVPKRKGRSRKPSAPGVEAPREEEREREPVKTVVTGGSVTFTGSMFGGQEKSSGPSLTGSMFSGMGKGMGKAGALHPTYYAASAFERESAEKLYPPSASASQCTPSTNLRSAPPPYTTVPFAGPFTGSYSASASLRSTPSPYASASSPVASSSTALDTGSFHQAPSRSSSPYGSGSASSTGSAYSPFGILNSQKAWAPVCITGKRPHEQMRDDVGGQGGSGVLWIAEPAKKIRRDKGRKHKAEKKEGGE